MRENNVVAALAEESSYGLVRETSHSAAFEPVKTERPTEINDVDDVPFAKMTEEPVRLGRRDIFGTEPLRIRFIEVGDGPVDAEKDPHVDYLYKVESNFEAQHVKARASCDEARALTLDRLWFYSLLGFSIGKKESPL
jgi:hypothetical protein